MPDEICAGQRIDQQRAAAMRKQKKTTRYAAHFRLQANACLYLARKATAFWAAASLTERAAELLDQAHRLETFPAPVGARGRGWRRVP